MCMRLEDWKRLVWQFTLKPTWHQGTLAEEFEFCLFQIIAAFCAHLWNIVHSVSICQERVIFPITHVVNLPSCRSYSACVRGLDNWCSLCGLVLHGLY